MASLTQYFESFGDGNITIRELEICSRHVSPEFFSGVVNRYLRVSSDQRFKVVCNNPRAIEFSAILSKLPKDSVGRVVLNTRKDVNPAVDCTIDCELHFVEGVLHIEGQWCIWKEDRQSKVAKYLLKPIGEYFDSNIVHVNNGDQSYWEAIETRAEGYSIQDIAYDIYKLAGLKDYKQIDEHLQAADITIVQPV